MIADKLLEYKAENIVVDPVMVSTSGSRLLTEEATDMLLNRLLPIGTVITPNIPEAEAISGLTIKCKDDMVRAAERIAESVKGGVLIKGGHFEDTADDLLLANGKLSWFNSERVENPNTHGTGCTLSSAIACNLAAGYSLEESIVHAKDFITGALKAGLNLGKGSGPLDHTYRI